MFCANSLKHYCFQLLHLLLLIVRLVLFITKFVEYTSGEVYNAFTATLLNNIKNFEESYDFTLKSIDFSDNFYLFPINKNVQCNSEGYH